MTTEALTMSQDDLFHRLRAAYLRGAKWTNDNVLYTPSDVEKAANDYADAVVSPLTPTVEKVETPAQGTPSPETQMTGDDAARYRWLRDHFEDVFAVNEDGDLVVQVKAIGSPEEDRANLDAAIDAAIDAARTPTGDTEPGEHQEVIDAIAVHNSGEEE